MPPGHEDFTEGIFFVPLQPVEATGGVVSAIADATDFQFDSDAPPIEQLIDYLRQKQLLLVLDNFEHLLSSAELVSDILASAPGVKILVTSREALKLREEWFHPIAGMRFSDDREDGQQSVPDFDAVRLFEQNARRAQPTLLARQGTGACSAHLPVGRWHSIGHRIGCGLAQCTACCPDRRRDSSAAWRSSLRAIRAFRNAIAACSSCWSSPGSHLSEEEQKILGRLSIFHGGCDQRAAEEVAGASLFHLASLVEKSLLAGHSERTLSDARTVTTVFPRATGAG